MMLWLALYLPQLPLESTASDAPVDTSRVIYETRAGRQTVCHLNATAAHTGIDPGMALTAARSLCHDLIAIERDISREQNALDGLALWAMRFTSKVSLEPPDGLILEIGASLRLFGGLDKLLDKINNSLEALGYSAFYGVAPIATAAWLLALNRRQQIITDSAKLRSALLPLPLTLLAIGEEKKTALVRLGLNSIGDCLRLPRDGLARRLGTPLLDSLDRALDRIPEARTFYAPPERFRARILLPEPISRVEALLFVLKRLLGQLAGFLRARDAGAQRLQLGLIKPFLPIEYIQLSLLQPGRNPQQLFALWREKLERHRLDAPVEGLELQARQLLSIQPQSLDLLTGARASESGDFIFMLERLKNRLGDDQIHQPYCHADHRPERRSRRGAFPLCRKADNGALPLRPLWLLPQPRPLAQDKRGAPRLHGPLTLLSNPERIESGWWDGADQRRDYYIARNQRQQRLWIFRRLGESPAWFLHGFFA